MEIGVLFAAPIPEHYHSVGETVQKAVEIAVQEAEENGMSKREKEVTPWILKRVGGSRGHPRRVHTCVVCPEPEGIRGPGIVEDRGGCSGGGGGGGVDVGK